MQKVIDYVKQYIGIISIVLALCILLTYSLSYFKVNTESKRAAEMYIGELKYTISIDGTSTNTLTVPAGKTIVDIDLTNQNEIKTYYKLLYLKNANISISYFNQTKNTSEEVTSYKSPSGVVESKSQNSLKLKIINNSSSNQALTFKVSGGYSTNTLADVEVPNTYTEITSLETPSTNTYFCKTNDTLTQGLEYIDGQYTYRYKQGIGYSSGLNWFNIFNDGWGVQLTDRESTDPVTSKLCTYINNKPVVSMSFMFYDSKATSIDLSSFDTSNVTSMSNMFRSSESTSIDVSNFDTSNVTDMGYMFHNSQATTIDVSNFDTSKVTDMHGMFYNSKATTIDVSNFDTSNVKKMYQMFSGSQASTLNVAGFNTSKVTDMSDMFSNTKVTTLNMSNFDTSNVTNMYAMFYNSEVNALDVSSFDTSKVTNMRAMFQGYKGKTLDVSKFNTSNVTDMRQMFNDTRVTSLDVSGFDTSNVTNMSYMFSMCDSITLDVSNFNTSKVTDMNHMFSSSKVATLDLSNFDTNNVTKMNYMFSSSPNLTTIYVINKFLTDKVTSSSGMFSGDTKLVGGNGTKYNSSYIDKTYARIDTSSTPGYFTKAAEKPGVPSSFATDSWATIINAVKNNNISKYKVGDTKTIDLGTTYGTHTIRISNTSTPSECSTSGFSQSACGFVIEFADLIVNHKMNDRAINTGGWPATSMRTFINADIYNSLPSILQSGIIETSVVTGYGYNDNKTNLTSKDKLYLLSAKEIYSDWSETYDSAINLTRQLDYYKNSGTSTSSKTAAIKALNGTAKTYWLRTTISTSTSSFVRVGSGGTYSSYSASGTYGVSPAFRIG